MTCVCTEHSNRGHKRLFPNKSILFSVFLDRFFLGYCCLGVAKVLTLGGLGVWWILDVLLLVSGNLNPNDGFSTH